MSLSIIFSNVYSANASILNDTGVLTTSFPGNDMFVREATMHIERNGTPTNVAYIMQILDANDKVLDTSQPYSIQNLVNEFGSALRGEPRFLFNGTFRVESGTTYKLAIRRDPSSGTGSNIYVHDATTGSSSRFCIIWGSTYSGHWDGGQVSSPITIRDDYMKLYYLQADANTAAQTDPIYSWSVRDWLYGGDTINGVATLKPPGAEETPNIGLRFVTPNGGLWSNLHNIAISNATPALGVTKHFFIRGDFIVRGPLNSHEGIIVLHGNGINHDNQQPATPGNFKTGWNIGWGPRKGGAPFIWLAEGGDYLDDAKQGGNAAASTLLIVTNNDKTQQEPPEDIPGYRLWPDGQVTVTKAYKWGHLEAGKIISHDIVHTDFIGPVVPLRFVDNPSGLQAFLDATQIEVFTSLVPSSSGRTVKNLGDPTKQWDNLYVKNLHVSGSSGNIRRGSASTNITTGVVFVPLDFPSGTTPHITATVKSYSATPTQPNTDPIVISVYNVTNTGFYVRTMIVGTAEHKHKIGDIRATGNNDGFSIQSDGNHSHSINALTETLTVTNGPNPSTVTNHTHQFARSHFGSTAGNSGNTNTGGSHTHGITKPAYTKETMLRNQSGGQVSLGGALANTSSTAQDLYSENAPAGSAALAGAVVKGVDLYCLAVI
jgi:hypothetical protein